MLLFVSDEKKQMVANVEKQLEEAKELVCIGLVTFKTLPEPFNLMPSSKLHLFIVEMWSIPD